MTACACRPAQVETPLLRAVVVPPGDGASSLLVILLVVSSLLLHGQSKKCTATAAQVGDAPASPGTWAETSASPSGVWGAHSMLHFSP